MGRRYLWRRSGVAILLSQTGGELERARSRVSFRDDSQPTHSLQPTSESEARRTTTKDHHAWHAECEDAGGDGVKSVLSCSALSHWERDRERARSLAGG